MSFKTIILVIVSFTTGVVISYLILSKHDTNNVARISECSGKYVFLNSQLDCDSKKFISKKEYKELVSEIKIYIEEQKKSSKVNHVSVYFRDLVQGPTFGIDEKEKFIPASLLKLPMLITYYSLAEKNPSILKDVTKFSQVNGEVEQAIDKDKSILPNTEYSIDNLLFRMIVNSDNLSYGLLEKYLQKLYPDDNIYNTTLRQLGLIDPRNPIENTFDVKSYASLFRQLYQASYLGPEMSNKALELLSKSRFKNALVAGVPQNIIVAHKFGDREIEGQINDQFHDCGIIYYPNNPYLLCVMTRGENSKELINTIQEISKMVYQEVESRKL